MGKRDLLGEIELQINRRDRARHDRAGLMPLGRMQNRLRNRCGTGYEADLIYPNS